MSNVIDQLRTALPRIAEIAYIAAKLEERQEIDLGYGDLEDKYNNTYKPIYIDWLNEKNVRDEEERGYISAYAERVLKEEYKKGEKL